MSAQAVAKNDATPFQRLNEDFYDRNQRLQELIDRLEKVGHRVSNTNVPESDGIPVKGVQENQYPFNEGELMDYSNRLARNASLLNQLDSVIYKLETLV